FPLRSGLRRKIRCESHLTRSPSILPSEMEMKRAPGSDSQLVLRARGGDRSAFATLVERYRNAVYGLAFHFVGDFETARDIAQDVFIRAFGRLGDLREPDKFSPWLRQMT